MKVIQEYMLEHGKNIEEYRMKKMKALCPTCFPIPHPSNSVPFPQVSTVSSLVHAFPKCMVIDINTYRDKHSFFTKH